MAKPHQKTSPAAIEKRQRMAEALKHRSRGLIYREIAEKMGIGQTTAYQYVRDAVDEIPRENADIVLGIDLDRLDKALEALWPAVLEGDVKAIEAMLKIHDRRAKLFHLDKVHGSNQDNGEGAIALFSQAVERMYEMQQKNEDEQ